MPARPPSLSEKRSIYRIHFALLRTSLLSLPDSQRGRGNPDSSGLLCGIDAEPDEVPATAHHGIVSTEQESMLVRIGRKVLEEVAYESNRKTSVGYRR